MARERRLDRDLRRLAIADFTDEKDVWIMAQYGAQTPCEGESGFFRDLNLVNPLQLVFDGILDRYDFPHRVVDLMQRGVQRRRLANDDAAREYAYGPAKGLPDVKLGAFTQAVYDQAQKAGWTVVSMKDDWKEVFPILQSPVTAIDILLEPDATMLRHAEANNARLLAVFPKGFALDATHRPHITLIQRFVRQRTSTKSMPPLARYRTANVTAMKLEAFKYYYVPTKTLAWRVLS